MMYSLKFMSDCFHVIYETHVPVFDCDMKIVNPWANGRVAFLLTIVGLIIQMVV